MKEVKFIQHNKAHVERVRQVKKIALLVSVGQDYYEGEDCQAILRHLAWLQKNDPKLVVDIVIADTLQVFNALDAWQISGAIKKNEERWWEVEPVKTWDVSEEEKPLAPGVITVKYSEGKIFYKGQFGDYTFLRDQDIKEQHEFSGEIPLEDVDQERLHESILNDVARQAGSEWKERNKGSFKLQYKHWDQFSAKQEDRDYIEELFQNDIKFRVLVLNKMSGYMKTRTEGDECKFWKNCSTIINQAIKTNDFSFAEEPVMLEVLKELDNRKGYLSGILEYILSEVTILMRVWADDYSHIYYKLRGEVPLFEYLSTIIKGSPQWVLYDTKSSDVMNKMKQRYLAKKLLKFDEDSAYIEPHFAIGSGKNLLSCNELKLIVDDQNIKSIFIASPPGAGKSTLSLYLTRYLAENDHLVFLVTPTDCLKIKNLKSMLSHIANINGEEELDYWKEKVVERKALFIFDDYERIKNKPKINRVIDLLLFHQCRIIVMSNQESVHPRIVFSRKLRLNNFLDNDVTEYISRGMSKTPMERLLGGSLEEISHKKCYQLHIPRQITSQPILLSTFKELIQNGVGMRTSENLYEPNLVLLFEKYFELSIQQALKNDKSLRKVKVAFLKEGERSDGAGDVVAHYLFRENQLLILYDGYIIETIDCSDNESEDDALGKAKKTVMNKVLSHYYLLKIAECIYNFYDPTNDCVPAEQLEKVMSKQALSCIGQLQFYELDGYKAPRLTYNYLLMYYMFHHNESVLHLINDEAKLDFNIIKDFIKRFNLDIGTKGYFSICEGLIEMMLLRATRTDPKIFYNMLMRLAYCVNVSNKLMYDYLLACSHLRKTHGIDQKVPFILDMTDINIDSCFETMVFEQKNVALFSYILHVSALRGAVDITKILLSQLKKASKAFKKDPNLLLDPDKHDQPNKVYWTVLHTACRNGDIDHVKIYIEAFPKLLNIKSEQGLNAFHAACGSNSIELLDWFHEHHVGLIMEKAQHRTTSLHWAANFGSFLTIEWLLKNFPRRFRIDERDDEGSSVLHIAAGMGEIQCVSSLLDAYPRLIDAKDHNRSTVLHTACVSEQTEMAIWLIERHPKLITMKDRHKSTPLHEACCKGLLEVVRTLICKSPDVLFATTEKTGTALTAACFSNHLDVAKLLVEHQPELLEIDGEFAYSVTIAQGHQHVAEWLLSKSQKLSKIISKKSKALLARIYAANSGTVIFSESQHRQNMKGIISAVRGCDEEKVLNLLEQDKTLTRVVGAQDFNLLHYACLAGHAGIARILLVADPELSDFRNKAGSTPLDLAKKMHRDDVVEMFESVSLSP